MELLKKFLNSIWNRVAEGDQKSKDSVENLLVSKIVTLRSAGKTQKEIAKEVGLTQNQIKGILQKLINNGTISRKIPFHTKKYKTITENVITYEPSKPDLERGKRIFEKYNIDEKLFRNLYSHFKVKEVAKYLNIPQYREVSHVAKYLGCQKRSNVTKRKMRQVSKKVPR